MTLPIFLQKNKCGHTLPNSLYTGQVAGPFFKRPKMHMSMVHAWSLRSLCMQSCQSFHGSLRDKDALRALGFQRAVRKLTIRLTAEKADGTLLTRFAAATRCLCSLRSPGDCFRALWMRTRAHDTRTRARTLGLLINCSRKLRGMGSKMLHFKM